MRGKSRTFSFDFYKNGILRIYYVTEDPSEKEYDDEHPYSPELIEEHEYNTAEELDKLL